MKISLADYCAHAETLASLALNMDCAGFKLDERVSKAMHAISSSSIGDIDVDASKLAKALEMVERERDKQMQAFYGMRDRMEEMIHDLEKAREPVTPSGAPDADDEDDVSDRR